MLKERRINRQIAEATRHANSVVNMPDFKLRVDYYAAWNKVYQAKLSELIKDLTRSSNDTQL